MIPCQYITQHSKTCTICNSVILFWWQCHFLCVSPGVGWLKKMVESLQLEGTSCSRSTHNSLALEWISSGKSTLKLNLHHWKISNKRNKDKYQGSLMLVGVVTVRSLLPYNCSPTSCLSVILKWKVIQQPTPWYLSRFLSPISIRRLTTHYFYTVVVLWWKKQVKRIDVKMDGFLFCCNWWLADVGQKLFTDFYVFFFL